MFDFPKKRRRRRLARVSYSPLRRKKVVSKKKKGKGILSRVIELGFHGSIREFKRQRELAKAKAKTKKIKETLEKNKKKTNLRTFFKR